MRRKVIVVLFALLLLGGILTVVWTAFDWPPPRFVLRYGLPPAGRSTGRTMRVEGIAFTELSAGYFKAGSSRPSPSILTLLRSLLAQPEKTRRIRPDGWPPVWREIPYSFWISTTEITNSQIEFWRPERKRDPLSPGDSHPSVMLSFEDSRAYCRWLSSKSKLSIRLPTEDEWEYACRARTETSWSFGNDEQRLDEHAWYLKNSGGRAHAVATKAPNEWGLFDMHGNVFEWCYALRTDAGTYKIEPTTGHTVESEAWPVARGGGWGIRGTYCTSSVRDDSPPRLSPCVGLRLVLLSPGSPDLQTVHGD